MRSNLIVLLLLLSTAACKKNANTYYAYSHYPRFTDSSNWPGSDPYRLLSLNKIFCLQSFPYEYIYTSPCEHCQGISNVFRLSDKKNLYQISRYFKIDNVFISNSGETIAYINNATCNNQLLSDSCNTAPLQFFKQGKLYKEYSLENLIDTDFSFNWLYHNNNDNKGQELNSRYMVGDTLYIITCRNEVIRFDIQTASIIDRTPVSNYLKNLNRISFPSGLAKFFKEFELEGLPLLKDSSGFRAALAKYLDAEIISFDEVQTYGLKYYEVDLCAFINSKGICYASKIHSNEYILTEESNKIIADIKQFLTKAEFISSIPYGLTEWKFEDFFFIRKKPDFVAKEEFKKYKDKVCNCDTFDGKYIPKNIEDCIDRLDTYLSDKVKNDIKNGHIDMGHIISVVNNWGLSAGTRLSCYFNHHGIYDPENMADLVITAYRLHLENKAVNIDSLTVKFANAEEIWRKNAKEGAPSIADQKYAAPH